VASATTLRGNEQPEAKMTKSVSEELVADYRKNGFVRVRGVLDLGQVERFRSSAEAFLAVFDSS
jgi:phytanoyl-CoA hydroxylase